MGDLVEADFAVAEMAKLRPYLVLINAKSVPQTARQTAVRYGEQYDTHKPACKAASESAGVADDKPENNPRRHCREGEPYWRIERCVGKTRGWVGSGLMARSRRCFQEYGRFTKGVGGFSMFGER